MHDIIALYAVGERGRRETHMFKLPNGKHIDEDMVELVMEDSSEE